MASCTGFEDCNNRVAFPLSVLINYRCNRMYDMAQTLKVDNVDDVLVEKLSDHATRHGRTIEAEHRAILRQALESNTSFEELAAKLRSMLEGRRHTPAEALLHESRDER